MDFESTDIALRAQEYHEGLKDVTFGPKEAYLSNTLLIGKAASLASHLRGLDYVENIDALKYLGAELGISGLELNYVLDQLQEVDFASVVQVGSQIKRVELKIPELRSGYHELGELWKTLNPGEIEVASLQVLETVASYPHSPFEIENVLGVDARVLNTILQIGQAGSLLDSHKADDGGEIIYSPLTVEEKPDAIISLMKKFPQHRIVKAFEEVERQQGIPIEFINTSEKDVIVEAVLLGVFCPVRIHAGESEKTFLFTPRGGLKRAEKIVLEKARALLACVRFGENFAPSRRILYPRKILETLRDRKGFAYPRPDFPEQYGLLVTKQIGFVEESLQRPGYYHFKFHDTPENMKALNIAIDLLDLGQLTNSRLEVDVKDFLDVSGSFSGTLPTRAIISRSANRSQDVSRQIVSELSKLARGIVR